MLVRTVEIISELADVLTPIATFLAALVAYYGLRVWRAQLRSNVELETARSVLRAALSLRDKMNYVRNPLSFLGDDTMMKRWNEQAEPAVREFLTARIEGEVLWGKSFMTAIEPLYGCAGHLMSELQMAVNTERDERELQEGGMEDPFKKRIESAVETIESFLRTRIEKAIGRA